MEAWLEIVIRQIILYSLPMLVSLSMVGMIEARLSGRSLAHAFYPLSWKAAWLPCLASIVFHRAVIFSLPRFISCGTLPAASRLAGHLLLCVLGFGLYAWSLAHPAVAGLPPLHHWWAKVLMYFNLCMIFLHLLPLPGMLLGECLLPRLSRRSSKVRGISSVRFLDISSWVWIVLAASPLPDAILGTYGIFPLYAQMATWATVLAH